MNSTSKPFPNLNPVSSFEPITANRYLYFFSLFVSAMTLFLILAGGLVTSHEAGLAVPDWPTSYGQWFPPMVGNVFWEHGHRMIAGSVGILTLILATLIQIYEKRKWLKKLAWISFAAVLAQALLGGLTVIYLLPPAVSITHACLAQTFFCLIVSITYFLKPKQEFMSQTEDEAKLRARLFRLLVLTTGFIYLQLILGATIRHTGYRPVIVAHIIVAFLVLIHVLLVVLRIFRFHENEKPFVSFSLGLGIATLSQIFLGMGAFIFTQILVSGDTPSIGRILLTTAHQTTGAVILATSLLLALMVRR